MELSVVAVNWNSGEFLGRLCGSLLPLAPELREILIADNASVDSSLEGVPAKHPFTILRFDRNMGFAGAANAAIKKASAKWILLLNSDVEIIPDSVRRLYEAVQTLEDAAIGCGLLKDLEGHPQTQFQLRPLPTAGSVLRDALFLDELLGALRFATPTRRPPSRIEEIEQPAAAYWLLRKRAWSELDGFDERFFPAWFEDVDFCRRLRETGWKIWFVPECPALHRGGISVKRLGRAEFHRVYFSNLLRYLKKHHRRAFPFLWFPVKLGSWARRWLIRK